MAAIRGVKLPPSTGMVSGHERGPAADPRRSRFSHGAGAGSDGCGTGCRRSSTARRPPASSRRRSASRCSRTRRSTRGGRLARRRGLARGVRRPLRRRRRLAADRAQLGGHRRRSPGSSGWSRRCSWSARRRFEPANGRSALSVPLELSLALPPAARHRALRQTFQLSGDPIQPFLVWLALTAPLAWLSPRPVVAAIHTFAIAATSSPVTSSSSPLGVDRGAARSEPPGLLTLTEGADPSAWMLSLVLLGRDRGAEPASLAESAPPSLRRGLAGGCSRCCGPTPSVCARRMDHGRRRRAGDALDRRARDLNTSFEERARACCLARYALRAHVHLALGRPARGRRRRRVSPSSAWRSRRRRRHAGAAAARLSPMPAVGDRRQAVLSGPRPAVVALSRSTDVRLVWLAAGLDERALAGSRSAPCGTARCP